MKLQNIISVSIRRFFKRYKTRFTAVRYKEVNRSKAYKHTHEKLAKELGTTITWIK